MLKKAIFVLSIVTLSLTLTGCQPTPETSAVTSKNDGTFEAAIQISAEDNITEAANGGGSYSDSFTSADGSVAYTVDLEIPVSDTALPIIRVAPHTITAEEAKTAANAIFGDAEIYEYSAERSKSELEEIILKLKKYSSDRTALVEKYNGDEAIADMMLANYETRIANLEELYETASDTVEIEPCQWTFYPTSHYDDLTLGIAVEEGYDDTMEIQALVYKDGIPYRYWVDNRDAEDYRLHSIYVFIDDARMNTSEQYSAVEPDQDEVENAKAEAERIMSEMNMGTWVIDSCEVIGKTDAATDETTYGIYITATPVYNDVKLTHHDQIANLKSDDSYASNYYYEEMTFCFSGGHLVSLFYMSPTDVVDILNDNVAVKSFDEIMEYAEAQLCLINADYFGFESGLDITIDRVELGLSRIRIKNNESDFYLTPAYTVYGLVPASVYGEDGTWREEEQEMELCVINAVDGSVINTELGY